MAHSRARRVFITAPLVLGADALLPSCERRPPQGRDLDATRWRPILAHGAAPDPSELFRLPPPPATDSAPGREEMDELVRRQAAGNAGAAHSERAWQRGASVRWNEIARELVAQNRRDLLAASRIYALLSVAQHDACVGVYRNKHRYRRPPPHRLSELVKPSREIAALDEPGYPCLHAGHRRRLGRGAGAAVPRAAAPGGGPGGRTPRIAHHSGGQPAQRRRGGGHAGAAGGRRGDGAAERRRGRARRQRRRRGQPGRLDPDRKPPTGGAGLAAGASLGDARRDPLPGPAPAGADLARVQGRAGRGATGVPDAAPRNSRGSPPCGPTAMARTRPRGAGTRSPPT